MRGIAALIVGLALAGCTQTHDTLWPGPDWLTTYPPDSAAAEADAATIDAGDAAGTRVPRLRTRRSSSTPPDQLQNPSDQRRPQVVMPSAPPPVRQVDQGNAVIAPRDPNKPYSADGFGYQR